MPLDVPSGNTTARTWKRPAASWWSRLPTAAPSSGSQASAGIGLASARSAAIAGGGNKVRKLEYLCAEAIAGGCDTLVTGGGRQSNHVRMTAAAANRLGLACTVLLAGGRPASPTGNVLLDYLLRADIGLADHDG